MKNLYLKIVENKKSNPPTKYPKTIHGLANKKLQPNCRSIN